MPFMVNPFFSGVIPTNQEKPKEKEETTNKENEDVNEEEEGGVVLHKTKIFQPAKKKDENESNEQNWDKIDENTSQNLFLSKNNYQRLKNSLGNLIRDEILQNIGDENDTMQRGMLNTIIPVNDEKKNKNKKKN